MADEQQKGCCRCRNAHWEDLGMHGVRRLIRGKGSCGRRIFWVLIILMCLGTVVYHSLGCVIYYLSYPTRIDYQLRPPDSNLAITLCNNNPWRLSLLKAKGWLKTLQTIYTDNDVRASQVNNITSTEAFTTAGHTLEDMVLKCRHGVNTCNHSNFTMGFTEHGFCYTFPRIDQYELNLVLNVEEYEYVELTNQRVGFTVILHDSTTGAFLSPHHVLAAPGIHTHVSLHSSHVNRLSAPYGSCTGRDGYSQTGCQASCLYQLIVDRCGCTPFWSLTHQAAHFDVSACSLHSHVVCVRKQVSLLTTDSLVSICHCDKSCVTTIYQATTSITQLTDRDYHHYLSDKHLYTVANQLLHATDIRARSQGQQVNQHIRAFATTIDDFGYQVETMKRNLEQVQHNMNGLMSEMYKRTWFHYYVGLNGIEKIFRHGFLPQWKMTDLQFLEPIVSGCQIILYSYENTVNKLDMISPSETSMRRTLFLTMDEQLSVRMELAIGGLDNFTKVYYSFLDMKPTSSYIVTPERRYDATLLPIEAVSVVETTLRSEYGSIANLLALYMEQILSMRNILKDMYMSKSGLNRTSYDLSKERFVQLSIDLQSHLEIFRVKTVQKAHELVETQAFHLKKQNDTMFTNWARLKGALNDTSNQLEEISIHHYPHILDLSQDGQLYLSNPNKLLSDLIASGLSSAVVDSVNLLVKRLELLKSRQNTISTLWQKCTDHYLTVWRSMLENESLKDFYTKLNADVKNVVQNPSSTNNLRAMFAHNKMLRKSTKEVRDLEPDELYVLLNADFPLTNLHGKNVETNDKIGQFRRLTDVSLQLQDLDIQIRQSYDNLNKQLQEYMTKGSLDDSFVRTNIVSLSVKLAADGHDLITELSAYSIVELLRDIGLAVVLLLGASAMTSIELMEILVTCICCNRRHSKKDKQCSDSMCSSPDSNSRHVTFQFPTENHVDSPARSSLKRPKLEYFSGDIDRMTSLDETHTEIL